MALGRRSREVADAGDEIDATLIMPGSADIIEVREESWGEIVASWVRTLLGFLLVAFVLLLVLYSILAATVLFVGNVDGRQVLVARNTFIAGVANSNSVVYASTDPDEDSFLSRLKVGFIGAPNASIYKIKSGQYDVVTFKAGTLAVNDKVVATKTTLDGNISTQQLKNQYLVKCDSGACKAGAAYTIINGNQIYGEIKRG